MALRTAIKQVDSSSFRTQVIHFYRDVSVRISGAILKLSQVYSSRRRLVLK